MTPYRSKKAGENIRRTYDVLLTQWGVKVRHTMVENDYGKTHVMTCGKESGEPVVLFHGVGDDSALMWIYNAKAWAKEYRLYAVDTIGGAGLSEIGNGYDASFDDVLWIDSVMDALNLQSAHMIGTSHGGYLAMRYLVARPNRVRKCIGISSAPSKGKKSGAMKMMMKIFMPEALFPTKRNVEKLMRKLSGDHVDVFTGNPDIMTHYTWLLKGFNNIAMGYHKVEGFSERELEILRERVCLLLGEKDPFEQAGGMALVKGENMNAHFYSDAGHGLNHEKAEEINQYVSDILHGRRTDIRNY